VTRPGTGYAAADQGQDEPATVSVFRLPAIGAGWQIDTEDPLPTGLRQADQRDHGGLRSRPVSVPHRFAGHPDRTRRGCGDASSSPPVTPPCSNSTTGSWQPPTARSTRWSGGTSNCSATTLSTPSSLTGQRSPTAGGRTPGYPTFTVTQPRSPRTVPWCSSSARPRASDGSPSQSRSTPTVRPAHWRATGPERAGSPLTAELVDYGAVRNVLSVLDAPARVALMTAIGVTKHTPGHDWKRCGERVVRASGMPYTIVRPGRLDYNEPGQQRLVILQGDTRRAGDPSDEVVSRAQTAQILVASLTSDAATRNRPTSWSPNTARRGACRPCPAASRSGRVQNRPRRASSSATIAAGSWSSGMQAPRDMHAGPAFAGGCGCRALSLAGADPADTPQSRVAGTGCGILPGCRGGVRSHRRAMQPKGRPRSPPDRRRARCPDQARRRHQSGRNGQQRWVS